MNSIEKFRETIQHAISTAAAAGAEPDQLNAVRLELAGLDRTAARDAAENLNGLIDGNDEDDLGTQLAPARDLLRRVAGDVTCPSAGYSDAAGCSHSTGWRARPPHPTRQGL